MHHTRLAELMINWRIGLLIVLVMGLAGCEAVGVEANCDHIVIGAGLPLSGGSEGTGSNVLDAITLAIEEINSEGGVDGLEIQLRTVDDGSGKDQDVVENAARALTSEQCLVAVVGHLNSDATLWAQEIYERADIVNITPASTASYLASNSKWTFRNLTHNGFKGQFLADFAKEELGIGKVGVIFDNDGFGTDLKTFFVDEAAKVGLDVVGTSSYSRTESPAELAAKFSLAVETFLKAEAESIYISGVLDEGVAIINEIRAQAGTDMPIIWSGWQEPLLIERAGSNAEGVYVPVHRVYDDANPKVGVFKTNFADRFGVEPGAFAPFAYDAIGLLAEAVDLVGPRGPVVRVYLASLDTEQEAYSGLTGPIYFDADGDLARHYISALVVRDGLFLPVSE